MKNGTKVLGVDLDDVTIDFNAAACRWHNAKFGTSYTKADITSYELAKVWNCTPEESQDRILEFYRSEEHQRAELVSGALEALRELRRRGHVLYAITSRPLMVQEETFSVLARHEALKLFELVRFLGHYQGMQPDRHLTKADVCREVGAQLLIDDMLSHARTAAAAGIPSFLFDAPWNQGEVPERVSRVKNWEQILRKLR